MMIRAEDLSPARRAGALAFLLVGYFFYAWSWNTVDILRPYIRESLGLSLTQSGSLYTLQSAGALVGAVVMGQVADRIGRRNALVISMIGYGACLLSGLLITAYWQLVVERLLMGFFMGSMFPIAVGIYSGLFAKAMRGRIAGLVMGTYNLAVAALGFLSAAAFAAGLSWTALLWAGAVPVALALFAFFAIPDDRTTVPFGGPIDGPTTATSKLPVAELFRPGVARQTILLATMTGLNFFAYQAFTGWATTYLKEDRAIDPAVIGDVLGWQFIGAAIGGLVWGAIGDRFGRRSAALGFVIAAALIPVYLFVPMPTTALEVTGLVYGIMLSASVVWGPWLSELYPPHLRSTAASIFNWGRIISMTAPLITAPLAEAFGLAPVMCLASVAFLAAALIWSRLPETLGR
ncbi:MFS transporter [Sandaracinobacteroides saxicola]|uniref:MFS transporter n=1 Tax=Sandaracinobacteroides saxicola TaxID=2759707 RepID=A0A7G5IEX1_9SPHN|nr:MFS transporter [Sandaracinobacteroides saxicola]QMW21913.1 MFS transporter [Sandaracinobacteroides saxicola]